MRLFLNGMAVSSGVVIGLGLGYLALQIIDSALAEVIEKFTK